MVEIQIQYQGDLRTEATHGPSRCTLQTDAPKDNAGKGESFSPTDLLATALASCAVTTMAIKARKEGMELSGVTAQVVKHMAADPARRVGALPVQITVPGEFSAEQRAFLEDCAHTCPVALSLSEKVTVDMAFDYPG